MFKVRLASSAVILLVTLLVVISGGDVLFAFICLISMIGMMELLRMVKIHKTVIVVLGYSALALLEVLVYTGRTEGLTALLVLYLLALMAVYVFTFPKYQAEQMLYAFFGLVYVGVTLSYIYQVRELQNGAYLVWLIFIAAWGSDSCAYCTGIVLGKHKMAPVLSPKKTWEGCIGGVLGAALLAFIYGLVMNGVFGQTVASPGFYAITCGCAAIISQIGDLTASALKRNNNIKDYGKLIPGHGGILDRYDSIIFVAPIVYYLSLALMR